MFKLKRSFICKLAKTFRGILLNWLLKRITTKTNPLPWFANFIHLYGGNTSTTKNCFFFWSFFTKENVIYKIFNIILPLSYPPPKAQHTLLDKYNIPHFNSFFVYMTSKKNTFVSQDRHKQDNLFIRGAPWEEKALFQITVLLPPGLEMSYYLD